MEILFLSIFSPDTYAHYYFPQLGSSPAIAVLTSGELATEKNIFFALDTDFAFTTFIVKNFCTSPSTTICLAKFKQTLLRDVSKFFE